MRKIVLLLSLLSLIGCSEKELTVEEQEAQYSQLLSTREELAESNDIQAVIANELAIDEFLGKYSESTHIDFLYSKILLAQSYGSNNELSTAVEVLDTYIPNFMAIEDRGVRVEMLTQVSMIFTQVTNRLSQNIEILKKIKEDVKPEDLDLLKYRLTADLTYLDLTLNGKVQLPIDRQMEEILLYIAQLNDLPEEEIQAAYDRIITINMDLEMFEMALAFMTNYLENYVESDANREFRQKILAMEEEVLSWY